MAEATSVNVVLLGPTGAGKSALAAAMTSGQSVKGQPFKATAAAAAHTLRVPVLRTEGKPLNIEMVLMDLPGAPDKLAAALAKDPKLLMDADLALICIPPTDKAQYVEAVKALDAFKAKSQWGKAVVLLTKSDEAKKIDGKTVKNLRNWAQVPERERVLRIESVSSLDINAEQIQTLLKALALDAHRASLGRKAAEAEAAKRAAEAKAAASKSCCTVA